MDNKCSTIGDLPVPPSERFPTQIIGKLKFTDFKYFLPYIQLRKDTIQPYKMANGSNSTLKDFKKILFKFIGIPRRNTTRQRYVKFVGISEIVHWFKVRNAHFMDPLPCFC